MNLLSVILFSFDFLLIMEKLVQFFYICILISITSFLLFSNLCELFFNFCSVLAVAVEVDMVVVEKGAGMDQIDINMVEIAHDLTEGASYQAFYVSRIMI